MDKFGSLHTVFEMEPYTDCLLKGDADRLIEVMQNLLENALKYGDGKRIIVHRESYVHINSCIYRACMSLLSCCICGYPLPTR